jgi:uncharacterized iron-regulated membrane protein
MTNVDDDFAAECAQAARPQRAVAPQGGARRIWTGVHRWIGLVAGAYLALAGVTGSILAFWQDIDEWLNRDVMRVAAPAAGERRLPLGAILAAARSAMPEAALKSDVPVIVKLGRHPGAADEVIYVTGLPERPGLDNGARDRVAPKLDVSKIEGHELFVDPYRGAPIGARLISKGVDPFSRPFIQIVNQLHYGLWIPGVGEFITAFLALVLLIGVIDGVALWWPRSGKWKSALTVRTRASSERLVFDLHKTFGVYFGVVLMVSIFSGMYMNFKPPWRALVSLASPLKEKPASLHSGPSNGRSPLTVDEAVALADRVFPDGKIQFVNLPLGAEGVYKIGKRFDAEVNEVGTHRYVVVDQYSGDVLYKEDPHDYGVGDRFFEWQYPLHSGEAFGDCGRAFMLLFGAVPVALYVTGFIRWRHKRHARRAVERQMAA